MTVSMARRVQRLSEKIGTGKKGIADRLREARARFDAGHQEDVTAARIESMAASDSPIFQRLARAYRRMKEQQ